MFFLPIALFAQNAPLTADAGKAARACAKVFMTASGDKDPGELRGFAQQIYLAMAATKADGVTRDFLPSAVTVMTEVIGTTPDPMPSAASCDARFPLARGTTPARLPDNPADRDILCLGTVSMLAGAANRMAEKGDDTLSKDVMGQMPRFVQRFEAARKVKNIGEDKEAMAEAMSVSFRASLDHGNLDTLYQSCKKLPD
jgi:hypothetical protein